MSSVIILGGSFEAWALAVRLPEAQVWVPQPERMARPWPVAPRLGLPPLAVLTPQTRLVIAPHPCDEAAFRDGQRLAAHAGCRHVFLRRPGWQATRRDTWRWFRDLPAAYGALPPRARVLVTLGRSESQRFHGAQARLFWRHIGEDLTAFPPRRGRLVQASGPFSVRDEIRFLRKNRIDHVLLRDAGGQGSWPKLAAARDLGITVFLLHRAPLPAGPQFETTEGVLAWLSK